MFRQFIQSLKREDNKNLLEAILKGYSVIVESESREGGKKLSEYPRYQFTKSVAIYRARDTQDNKFNTNDYITLLPKFAVEHAESTHVYEEETQQVIKAVVHPDLIVDASNPGEYFYKGDPIEGKVVYVTKGDEYDGEIPNLMESMQDNQTPVAQVIETYKNDPSKMLFWHGGNLDNVINPKYKKGRHEYGPGLYAITHFDTALKYAKGSRKLYLLVVNKGNDLNDVLLNRDDVTDFVRTNVIRKLQADVLNRLNEYYKDDKIKAYLLNNIVLNESAMSSSKMNLLRDFYVSNGVDYEIIDHPFGWNGKMIVLYNMDKIEKTIRYNPKETLNSYDLMESVGTQTAFGDPLYHQDVNKDSFIHFTTLPRAKEIRETGKLLMNPPHEKFGTDSVDAVSATLGKYVPTVQHTHMGHLNKLVAILFKTDTVPDYGVPEEVKWHEDVNITDMKIMLGKNAVEILKNNNAPKEDDYEISYKKPITEALGFPLEDPPMYGDSDYKQRGGNIISMSPDKYLNVLPPLDIDEYSSENIDILAERIKNNEKTDPATLYIEKGKIIDHDGRHRAHAAKKLGLKQIPVLIIDKDTVTKHTALPEAIGPVYHGSPKDFKEFSYKYLGNTGTSEGYGFYFTTDKSIAERYTEKTGKLFTAYIDIKKPLNPTKKTITKQQLAKFIKALDPDGEGYLSNWGDVYSEGYNAVLRTAIENEYTYNNSDVDIISGIINADGKSPEIVYPILKKTLGYDGIISQPEWANGAKIVIPFSNEQIKQV